MIVGMLARQIGRRKHAVADACTGIPDATPCTRLCNREESVPDSSPELRRHLPATRHQGGFSLLEVIAAMLLLAIAFTALMKVAGGAISLTQNAAAHSEAAMWAQSLLDSAFVGQPIKPGASSGHFDRRFRWQLQVTPWRLAGKTPPDAPLQLYQLDLDVRWGPPGHVRSAHFRTLRLSGPPAAATQVAP